MQVPWRPLVIATGRPRHSGQSRCSMEAKKAFMSIRMMARGQITGQWSLKSGHSMLEVLLANGMKTVSVVRNFNRTSADQDAADTVIIYSHSGNAVSGYNPATGGVERIRIN